MVFNETNVVEEWNECFPETVEDNVSDNDTESDVVIVTELPFIQEKLRIIVLKSSHLHSQLKQPKTQDFQSSQKFRNLQILLNFRQSL